MIVRPGTTLLPNLNHPLNVGRVAWWKITPSNYGGGKLIDVMGRNHGSMIAMQNANNGWRGVAPPGGWGSVLTDGSAGYVSFFLSFLLATYTNPPPPLTLSYWSLWVGGTFGGMVDARYSTGHQGFILYQTAGVNNLYSFQPNVQISGSVTVNDGRWHMLTATFDAGGNYRLYTDGVLDAGPHAGANWTLTLGGATGQMTMGHDYATDYGHAYCDSLSLHSRCLSAAEVAADYALSRQGYPGVLSRVSPAAWSVPTTGGLLMRRRRAIV